MSSHFLPPEATARFRSILPLGQGGMAEVFLVAGRGAGGFHKLLVLKTLRSELAGDPAMNQQFLSEARISARMNHPNVVQVYEVINAVRPCMVMEYLEGQAISAIYQSCGEAFTTAMQLRVISEALAGLHYSHELQDYDGTRLELVHRDVSPQNIFVTYDGVVKVLDFGIAKATSRPGTTLTGFLKGKIRYMAREQMMGETIDRRADVFSAGCLLWQAATQVKLWNAVPDGTVMRRLLAGDIPRPSSVRPVDPEFESIVMKALAPNPAARFATAQALRMAIDEYSARTYPDCTMREVGAFIARQFASAREACAHQIRAALAANPVELEPGPLSEPRTSFTPIAASETVCKVDEGKSPLTWGAQLRPKSWPSAAIVALALVLAGVAVTQGVGRKAAPPVSASALVREMVELHLDVTPREATISLDGERVRDNPGVIPVAPSPMEHELRIALDGYSPIVRSIRTERDLSLELTLDKSPAERSLADKAIVDRAYADKLPADKLPAAVVDDHSLANANDDSANRKPSKASQARQPPRPAARPHDPPAPKPKAASCEPPFFFDHGIKTYKPECL